MILVHGFAGAITTKYTLKLFNLKKISKDKLNILWIVGITAGVFPDFDLLYIYFNKDLEHRKLITHSLVPYLTFFLINIVILYFLNKRYKQKNLSFYFALNAVFFIGVLFHLILDFFVGGLSLLSPINYNYYGYRLPYNTNDNSWQFSYFTSYYLLAEFLVFAFFAYLFRSTKNFIARYLPFLYFIVALGAIVFVF